MERKNMFYNINNKICELASFLASFFRISLEFESGLVLRAERCLWMLFTEK